MADPPQPFPDPRAELATLLVVGDLARSVGFYRDMLGADVDVRWDTYARLRIGTGTLHLATESPGTEDKPGPALAPPGDPATVTGELVVHVSDCRAVHRELTTRGVTFLAPPSEPPRGGEVRCFLRDPDGHLIELSQTASTGSADTRERLVLRFYEDLWNRWRLEVADEILSPSISFRGSLGATAHGRDAFKDYVGKVQRAFPDWHNQVDELHAAGDRVIARLTWSGTHTGPLGEIPPTGRRVTYVGAAFFRIATTMIDEAWIVGDTQELWRALGHPAS
jgi:predicted ester cyclase/catechol 2,3-dioxygenase-like lactoylglutathione lyase family enzyme